MSGQARKERLLPQSPDAEQAVICAMLIGGEAVVEDMDAALRPECFTVGAHATLFAHITELVRAHKKADFITLTNVLRDRGALEEVGGAAGVTELFALLPSAANVRYHAEIVREMYSRRRVIAAGREMIRRAWEPSEDGTGNDSTAIVDEAMDDLLSISEQNNVEETFRQPKEGVFTAIEALENAYNNRGGIQGISTGLVDLDRMLGGLKPKQQIIVCGSTGMGKTALMLNLAKHIAVREKMPVAILTLEMSYDELTARALHEEAAVSLQRARDGFMAAEDFPRLTVAASRLAEAPMWIDETAAVNVHELKAKCRRAVKKFGARVIFVDYLQLLESTEEGRDENRQQELTKISRACKLIAKGLNITLIVGAQLNRKPDERKTEIVINPNVKEEDEESSRPRKFKRLGVPMLGDLRESGAIGQDADIVIAPYRPWYWSKMEEDKVSQNREWASLFVLKQRNGPIGQIICHFIPDETRFASLPDAQGMERPLFSNNPEQRQVRPDDE